MKPLAASPASAEKPENPLIHDLNHIMVAVEIYEQRGLNRAARALRISKSQAHDALKQLEHDCRHTLFEGKPLRPNAAGEHLYQTLGLPVARIVRNYVVYLEGTGPLISIGASEYVLQEYIAKIIAEFRRVIPELRICLRAGGREQLEAKLVNHEIHLAILTVEQPPAGLVSQKLLAVPVTFLVPARLGIESVEAFFSAPRLPVPLACPPPTEGVSRRFLPWLRKQRKECAITIDAASTAMMPQLVAGGSAAGPCVGVKGLTGHPGVKALPLPGLDPLEVRAVYCGQPSELLQATLGAIGEAARALTSAE